MTILPINTHNIATPDILFFAAVIDPSILSVSKKITIELAIQLGIPLHPIRHVANSVSNSMISRCLYLGKAASIFVLVLCFFWHLYTPYFFVHQLAIMRFGPYQYYPTTLAV